MGPEQLFGAVVAEIAADRIISATTNAVERVGDDGVDEERRTRIQQHIEDRDMEALITELDERERAELRDALEELCYQNNIDPAQQRPRR